MSTTRPPLTRCSSSNRSHSSPALAWRNQTRSPMRQVGAVQRRLDLAGALLAVEPQAGREDGAGEPVASGRARGGVAAAEHGGDAARRPPHHREREEGGGPWREAGVGVEQRRGEEAGAGCDLGDRRLGGRALHRARAAAVDEAQRRQGLHDRRAAGGQLARRRALHGAQADARAGGWPAGRRRRRSAPRTSSARRARVRAPRSRGPAPPPARACAAATAWRRCGSGRRAATSPRRRRDRPLPPSIRSRCSRESTISGDAVARLAQRRAVDRRIGDHRVVAAQPQRLRQREGEQAAEAGGERAVDQGPAADRLGGQADALAAGAAQQVGGVGVERVEVDGRERRLEVGGGEIQLHGVARYPPGAPLECRASLGT